MARGDRSLHPFRPVRRGVHGYAGVATDAEADPARPLPDREVVVPPNAVTPLRADSGGDVIPAGTGEGNVTILLTGDETTTGHFFRGPDDPADTPEFLVLLLPGDHWTDTTVVSGWPFVEKVRNAANDGWDFAGLVLTVAGKVRAVVRLELANPDGAQVTMATYDENEVGLGRVSVGGSGLIQLVNGGPGEPNADGAQVTLDPDGTLSLANNHGSITLTPDGGLTVLGEYSITFQTDGPFAIPASVITNLPTADPAVAGALWNDTGTVKVSAG